MSSKSPLLSVVVPVYNEQASLQRLHTSLAKVLGGLDMAHEILYVNDGSTDDSQSVLRSIARTDKSVRIVKFSRNFGKELAVTAGLHAAKGQAILMLDADGQHPVALIPKFVKRWQAGAKVIVGVCVSNQHRSWLKGFGSRVFYRVVNRFAKLHVVAGSTDFRLIDRSVADEFNRLTERNRITRGLIDWLGHEQTYVEFEAEARIAGDATYSLRQLMKLFIDGVVSMSVSPLYLVAYIGAVVLPLSLLLGLGMAINAVFGDPLHIHATGGAYVAVLTLCLVGILMVSQGIIGLYLSHIHAETQARPLYILDNDTSWPTSK